MPIPTRPVQTSKTVARCTAASKPLSHHPDSSPGTVCHTSWGTGTTRMQEYLFDKLPRFGYRSHWVLV